MISMRYAFNFAHGAGLFWNDGGSVEGYSNFLFTLLLSLFHFLVDDVRVVPAIVIAVNSVLACGSVVMAASLVTRLGGTRSAARTAAWAMAISPQFLLWSVDGFETTLTCLLVLASLHALASGRVDFAAVLLSLGVLTRDDFCIFSASAAIAYGLSRHDWRKTFWGTTRLLWLSVLAVACHTVFRAVYYGNLLPNTYYLKATGWPLSRMLSDGAIYAAAMVPSFLGSSLVVLAGYREASRDSMAWFRTLLPTLYLSLVVYAVRVAGDSFPGSRLFVTSWPLLAVSIGLFAHRVSPNSKRRDRWAVLASIVLIGLGPFDLGTARKYRYELARVVEIFPGWMRSGDRSILKEYFATSLPNSVSPGIRNVVLCEQIRAHSHAVGDSSPSMAVYYAGTAPYMCSEFRAIDLLGKSDGYVAELPAGPGRVGHNKWDYEWSLGVQRPDYLLSLLTSLKQLKDLAYLDQPLGDYNWQYLARSPTFQRCYAPNPLEGTNPIVFVRTDIGGSECD